MKILYCVNNPYLDWNPYTATIIDGLKKIDPIIETDWGIENFWTVKSSEVDIVHVMWPNELLLNLRYSPKDLVDRVKELKDSGVKIVSTCHNLEAHYASDNAYNKAYEIIYENSDIIFHLGEFSYELFKDKYSSSHNVIIYHHIYDDRYKNRPTKSEARKKLGLSDDRKYVLCFGALRSNEERNMLVKISKELKKLNVQIIAPGFYRVVFRRQIGEVLKHLYYHLTNPSIVMKMQGVKDCDLPLYFAASDISLIMRMKILNSGNLPLGFYMGNIVVGPDLGNVGTILRETDNIVFQPNDVNSIISSIKAGLDLINSGKGEINKAYAEKEYSSHKICCHMYSEYKKILS